MIVYEGLDNLVWFFGIVEAIDDPTNNGRVRVRAFGFHPTVNEGTVEVDELPWAIVLRSSPHMHTPMDVGDTVVGVFMDGRDAQMPLVFGALTLPKFGVPTVHNSRVGGSGAGGNGPAGQGNPDFGAGSTEHAEEAYNYFIDRLMKEEGMSREEAANIAAGIVGNLQAESGANLNTGIKGDGGAAWGIAQWHPVRRADFEREFGIPFEQSTFQDQLDFVWWELQNTESEAYDILLTASSSSQAAYIFDKYYERSSGAHRQRRIDNAAALLQEFGEGTINADGEAPEDETAPEEAGENPMSTATNESLEHVGESAVPPQISGEDVEQTPAHAAAATNRERVVGDGGTTRENGMYGGARVSQPSFPVGRGYRNGVWNTRYNGSYIEMHAGENLGQEHISITHSSGAHVLLDQAGNITIHSIGKVHNSSMGNYEVQADEMITNVAGSGYSIHVTGGGMYVTTTGNIDFRSGGKIKLAAASDIELNAGGKIDVSGQGVAISAVTHNIDLLANSLFKAKSLGNMSFVTEANMAHQSDGDMTTRSGGTNITHADARLEVSAGGNVSVVADAAASIRSGLATTIRPGGNLNLGSAGNIVLDGSTIQMNSPGHSVSSPGDATAVEDAAEAVYASVGRPPAAGFAVNNAQTPERSSIAINGTDDEGPF